MKSLYLLRHAKSSWDNSSLDDHDRPLNNRGYKAAKKMGDYAQLNNLKFDYVLCSSAQRTKETLSRFEKGYGKELQKQFMEALYLASPNEMLKIIQNTSDNIDSLMIISHNPGTHVLALELTKFGSNEDILSLNYKFPTAALAELQFPAHHWSDINHATGHLKRFKLPGN